MEVIRLSMKRLATVTPAVEPSLWELCEKYIRAELDGQEVEFTPFYEETLLKEIMEHGEMTPEFSRRAFDIYERAAKAKPDAILIECSTIGDVSYYAQPLYELMGIPLISLDQPAAEYAVSLGKRIGMIVNLHTTLGPSERLLKRCAAAQGKEIEVVLGYKKAFGMSQEQIQESIFESCRELASKADVLFLAQPSMTRWAKDLQAEIDIPVVPTLPLAAKAVRRILCGD